MSEWARELSHRFHTLYKGTDKEQWAKDEFWKWYVRNKDRIFHNDRVLLQHSILGKYYFG